MNKLFSTAGVAPESGLALIRISTGLLLLYHGLEVFDATKMQEYAAWDSLKQTPAPLFMAYLGKGSELVAGGLLAVGLLTRLACLLIMGTMAYITFFVGNGKFWYEDQHPFLFVLLALVFVFTGPGKWSVDRLIEGRKAQDKLF